MWPVEPKAVPTTWSFTEDTDRAGVQGSWQVRERSCTLTLGARPDVASQLHN